MKFLSIILVAFICKAAAFPSGAGDCPAGAAAPGGAHLTGMPGLVGPLSSEGSFVMTVGGVEVSDGEEISAPLDFDITVTGAGGFKGILIRIGGATADQVTSTDLTAPAGACVDVGSATHSNADIKTVGTALVSLDADSVLDVDISVVVANEPGAGLSTFFYSSFKVNAVAGDLVPVSTPIAAPTAGSISPTTLAPVVVDPIDATPLPIDSTPPPTTIAPFTAVPGTPAPTTAAPVTTAPITMAPVTPAPVDPMPSYESDFPSSVPDGESDFPSVAVSDPPAIGISSPSPEIGTPTSSPIAPTPTSGALNCFAGTVGAFAGVVLALF